MRPDPPSGRFSEIAPASPGRLASHYAPSLPVRLDATSIAPDEAQLAFGTPLPGAGLTWNLSESGNLEEAAARLFAGLRFLDAEGTRRGLKTIAAQPIPATGSASPSGTVFAAPPNRAPMPRP